MIRISFYHAGVKWLFLIACFSCFSALRAQTVEQQQAICAKYRELPRCPDLFNEFSNEKRLLNGAASLPMDQPTTDTVAFAERILAQAWGRVALQTISTTAARNQTGASPTANGSTNLVSKPTTTDFIALAAESGAFTDTLNGSTMTIQSNALGITKYFSNHPVFARWNSKYADAIQPLTFTVTLNIAQSSASTATPAGSANPATPSIASVVLPANNASFSSFAANYAVYRPYNPQDPKFRDNWNKALNANQKAIDDATQKIAVAVNTLFAKTIQDIAQKMTTPLSQWHKAGAAAEKAGNFDAFVQGYSVYDDAFANAVLNSSPDAPKNVLALSQALDAFNQAIYTVLDQARGTPLATVSYQYSTPPGKPATHNGTVVLSYLAQSGAQLTGNFTASIYAMVPAGAKYGRLRDFQASAEFDKPFGGTPAAPRATWSVAGYGQYQYDPTVLNINQGNLAPGTNIVLPGNAQVLLGVAGWLGVAQGKIVFNIANGVSVPVAVKWSSRTDLINQPDWRGQIGLSYDLSALSKLITQGK